MSLRLLIALQKWGKTKQKWSKGNGRESIRIESLSLLVGHNDAVF